MFVEQVSLFRRHVTVKEKPTHLLEREVKKHLLTL